MKILTILCNMLQVGERIRVILDCDDNTLSFEKNYEFLGVAFRGQFKLVHWSRQTIQTDLCYLCNHR